MSESKITNKGTEEGIEVIIRIRPILGEEEQQARCLSISDCEENTIVVESNNKRELFSFDHIAGEQCGQKQLYERLGEPVLEESLKGYNCCVFSYGQTGAGKTYSILGQPNELVQNPFSESRGILPRLLEQMFTKINDPNNGYQQITISCSYLEIYNQQIIDLLTRESRNLAIRQDLHKGVFIDGLTEISIKSYQDVLGIIAKGLTIRKTAATFMNAESSRSHTIFTMLLNIQYLEEQVKKSFNSKIHIVDLAGSERIKLAKVQGQRFKQGCNINKSLLTLSHVISSLVQSAKKKKHIPFRDSKLTFFLKDSLGGNSKTKLLANVSPKASYLGDTISTLMFAKRAKIIKSKVERNQNISDNFETLRTQIKKLRQELAQTKFVQTLSLNLKEEQKSIESPKVNNKDVFLPTQSFVQMNENSTIQSHNQESLKIFQDNQNSYRVIVEQSLARLKQYGKGISVQHNFKTLFDQKKSLQKTVFHQQKLLSNIPAFTKLFIENIEYRKKIKYVQSDLLLSKQQIQNKQQEIIHLKNTVDVLNADIQHLSDQIQELHELQQASTPNNRSRSNSVKKEMDTIIEQHESVISKSCAKNFSSVRVSKVPLLALTQVKNKRRSSQILTKRGGGFKNLVQRQNKIIDEYESTIEEMKKSFQQILNQVKNSYELLEQMYHEQKRQKHEICKRKRKQPQVQALQNDNQYLKLNVMQLQAQITKLEQQIFKKGVQIKTSKEAQEKSQQKLIMLQKKYSQDGMKQSQIQSLIQKVTFIKLQAQRANQQLNDQLDRDALVISNLKSKLDKQTHQNYLLFSKNQSLTQFVNSIKTKISQMTSLDNNLVLLKQTIDGVTFDENSVIFEQSIHENMIKDISRLTFQRDKLRIDLEEFERQKTEQSSILQRISIKILNLTKQMSMYKQSSTTNAQQVSKLSEKVDLLTKQNKKNFDRTIILQVDLNRLRKENDKNQCIVNEIAKEFSCEPGRFIEQVKYIKTKNKKLINQNIKLQQILNDVQKKATLLKNSKSLSNLATVRQLVGASIGQSVTSPQAKQQHPIFNRQLDTPTKKKQPKKGLFSTFLQQKQKTSVQFKAINKPLTQQGLNRFKKNMNNK